jgi:hypothetical protein
VSRYNPLLLSLSAVVLSFKIFYIFEGKKSDAGMKISYEVLLFVIKVRRLTYFYTTIHLCQPTVVFGDRYMDLPIKEK